jgi:2-dehydropantoate 2-reductase
MSLDPELRLHLAGCMREIFETAPKVLGRPWPAKLAAVDAEKILKSTERNSGGKPSMLLDWEASRPMELEAILGNPVSESPPSIQPSLTTSHRQIRIARSKGIEMPRLQSLYALLRFSAIRRAEEVKKAKL